MEWECPGVLRTHLRGRPRGRLSPTGSTFWKRAEISFCHRRPSIVVIGAAFPSQLEISWNISNSVT